MTRVQRREEVVRHHPRIKRLTKPRDKAETTSAMIPSHEWMLRSARRKAMRYSAANSQSEFHHAAMRAVKQRTNQSHAAKDRQRRARSPMLVLVIARALSSNETQDQRPRDPRRDQRSERVDGKHS